MIFRAPDVLFSAPNVLFSSGVIQDDVCMDCGILGIKCVIRGRECECVRNVFIEFADGRCGIL